MISYLKNIWSYRHFIETSVKNDFRNRFARSKIAGAWVVLQPLVQVAMFSLILSNVLAAKLPGVTSSYGYAIYLLAGMAAWGLFSEIVNRSMTVFIEHGNTLKKIVFPRICLPVIVASTALVNFTLFMLAVLGVLLLTGVWPGFALLSIIPLTLLTVGFALSLGLFLGTLNVFMRDVGQVMQVMMQLWFWFTPVVYPSTIIPEKYQPLMKLNPMYAIVDGFHRIIVYGQQPRWNELLGITVFTLLMTGLALFMFKRAAPEMADVL